MSRVTITEGIKELHGELAGSLEAGSTRERRSGAGRPSITVTQPGIEDALLALVDKASYGNPENPLREHQNGTALNIACSAKYQETGGGVHLSLYLS
jgi:hypothetical protein